MVKITKWMCSHCGQYSEDRESALTCCGDVYEQTKEEEDWD
jgi:hypothetical protein